MSNKIFMACFVSLFALTGCAGNATKDSLAPTVRPGGISGLTYESPKVYQKPILHELFAGSSLAASITSDDEAHVLDMIQNITSRYSYGVRNLHEVEINPERDYKLGSIGCLEFTATIADRGKQESRHDSICKYGGQLVLLSGTPKLQGQTTIRSHRQQQFMEAPAPAKTLMETPVREATKKHSVSSNPKPAVKQRKRSASKSKQLFGY